MRRAMEIDLGIRGVARTVRGIQDTARASETAAEAYERHSTAAERLQRSLEGLARQRQAFGMPGTPGGYPVGGGRGPGGGGAGGSGDGGGPEARLRRARELLAADPDSFDSRYRAKRAEDAYQRAERTLEGKGFLDKLSDAVGTSRIGFGGPGGTQVMPLVNRVLPLFGDGLSKLIGPLGLAASGLSVVAAQAERSALALREQGYARMMSGGTPSEIAALTRMGIDAGDIAGAAAAFRQRISLEGGDPYAISEAQRRGLNPTSGRNFGPQNEAQTFLRGLEELRKLRGNPNEQLRVARLWGMDPFLNQVNVSDDLWEEQKRGIAARGRALGDSEQVFRDRDAAKRIWQDNWNDQFNGVARWWAERELAFFSPGNRVIPGEHQQRFGLTPPPTASKTDELKDAMSDTVDELKKINQTLGDGVYGGGSRVQEVLRLRGPALSEVIRANAKRAGSGSF